MGDSIDLFKSTGVEIDIQLVSKRLLRYAAITILIYGAFTITFYKGIPVKTVLDVVGASKKSEDLVETYNTYSGYVMALVEVLVSMYVEKFMPAIDVYVHNALFGLQRGPIGGQPRPKPSRYLRTVLLFLFPIVLSLTMSNSIRSLQAVQSNAGFERIMLVDDLKKEQPELERIKAKAKASQANQPLKPATFFSMTQDERVVSGNIMKNAIRQQVTPFKLDTSSPCGVKGLEDRDDKNKVAKSTWTLNAREAAASAAVYGFIPREWNSEAMTTKPTVKSSYKVTYKDADNATSSVPEPADFSMKTAYEMLVQATMVIGRAYGNSVTAKYDCSLSEQTEEVSTDEESVENETSSEPALASSDLPSSTSNSVNSNATRQLQEDKCEGGVSSLSMMHGYIRRDNFTARQFALDVVRSIGHTVSGITRNESVITLEKSDLTPQIKMETMQIDLVFKYPEDYWFADIQTSFCGSRGCAYLENSTLDPFPVQPEIGVVPYLTDCSLGKGKIHYNADFRAFYPADCSRVNNSAFLYGYGSYITGDEYGSKDTDPHTSYIGAYIKSPRRRIRFTFAKVTWTTVDLAQTFDASCGEGGDSKINCTGLWYKLQPSGRFLFAGDDALPTQRLAQLDFRLPIPLVQLNSPTVHFDYLLRLVRLERLVPRNFQKTQWHGKPVYNGSALGGDQCSMLVDSYLKHVNENNFFIERPMQAMYTSFFFFLMENAGVTKLNDTSAALNGVNTSATALFKDRLGNVKLSGDIQVRRIDVAIPSDSLFTTLFGTVCIFFATAVIIFVPANRAEYFYEEESKAEQFVALGKDADYPDNVHNKLLVLSTRERVRFNNVRIESLVLVPKDVTTPAKADSGGCSVQYSRLSQFDRDSDEEPSEGTSSEEIA